MYQNFFNVRTSYDKGLDKKSNYTASKLQPSLNNILATVHQQLKYTPKPSVPKIPKAIAETMQNKVPEVLLMDSGVKQRRRRGGKCTVPQLQADIESKHHEQNRRLGITTDMMSYKNQKRYREVLRQKRILENMLKEHQKLQTDRDTIASEINYMRCYLDNIRNKLDVSLRKLNSQKTMTENCPHKVATGPSRANTSKICKRAVNAKISAPSINRNRTNRMAGGFDNVASRNRIASKSSAGQTRSTRSISGGSNKQRQQQRQWVYATRIERKGELNRLFLN